MAIRLMAASLLITTASAASAAELFGRVESGSRSTNVSLSLSGGSAGSGSFSDPFRIRGDHGDRGRSGDRGNRGGGRGHEGSVSAVPEASTWAMMIIGMGMMGVALRRGRRSAEGKLARA